MLIVVSMHRSGSSLLAGLICENGFYPGAQGELIAGRKNDNPKGFIERYDVVSLNEEMISNDKHSHLLPLETIKHAQDQIANIAQSLKRNKVNLLKDPRFCLTLASWLPFLSRPKIVFLVRNPLDVAWSLFRRQSYPLSAGLALWEHYNYAALRTFLANNACPYVIHFDELIQRPEETISQLVAWYQKPNNSENNKTSSTSFFNKQLIHSVKKNTCASVEMTVSQRNLYEVLKNKEVSGYSGPFESDTMRVVLDNMKEFVGLGYIPNTGTLLDLKHSQRINFLEQNLKEVVREKNTYKKLINQLQRLFKQLLMSKSGKLLAFYYRWSKFLHNNKKDTLIEKIQKTLDE